MIKDPMKARLISGIVMVLAALIFLMSAMKAGRTMYYIIALLFFLSGALDFKHYFDEKKRDQE